MCSSHCLSLDKDRMYEQWDWWVSDWWSLQNTLQAKRSTKIGNIFQKKISLLFCHANTAMAAQPCLSMAWEEALVHRHLSAPNAPSTRRYLRILRLGNPIQQGLRSHVSPCHFGNLDTFGAASDAPSDKKPLCPAPPH